jgi:hypothetical protein
VPILVHDYIGFLVTLSGSWVTCSRPVFGSHDGKAVTIYSDFVQCNSIIVPGWSMINEVWNESWMFDGVERPANSMSESTKFVLVG